MAERDDLTPEQKAVTEIRPTEQDIDRMTIGPGPQTAGQPGRTDERTDVDHDDDQTTAATSHPLI